MDDPRTPEKFNYNEQYYTEVDGLYNNWRRSVWDESLGDVEQEKGGQIGPSGWLEVLDDDGNVIVNIDGDGMEWNHHTTHENGGVDEVSVAGLSGLLADEQDPLDHATDHQNGGGDEISVAGLSGLLADQQTPLGHHMRHENGGDDEISVAGLSGTLADPQTPSAHASEHELGGGDELEIVNLATAEVDTALVLHPDGLGGIEWGTDAGGGGGISGIDVDEAGGAAATDVQTVDFGAGFDVTEPSAGTAAVALDLLEATVFTDHSARHENGGADELEIINLATAETDNSLVLAPDGLGGVEFRAETGGGGGISGIDVKEATVATATDVQILDFGAGFDIAESPVGTATVALDLTESTTFTDHSARHEDGGADEISVAALSGELADAQKVKDHTHAVTGTGATGGGATLNPVTLGVSGNATVTGTLGVTGAATLSGATLVDDTLTTTGDITAPNLHTTNSVHVDNDLTVDDALVVNGATTLNADAFVDANLAVSGNIEAVGDVLANGQSQIASGPLARYVPLATISTAINFATTAADVSKTTLELTAVPANVVAVQLLCFFKGTTPDSGANIFTIYGYQEDQSTEQSSYALILYAASTGAYNTIQGIVTTGSTNNRSIRYQVDRSSGTLTYAMRVIGYWTTA